MGESRELNPDECVRLLVGGIVGRVAIATPTGPHILPVNYSVVDDALIFRKTPYSLLGTYGRNAQIAFEVDHFDYEDQRGWSVVARGRADAVTDPDELVNDVFNAQSPAVTVTVPWLTNDRLFDSRPTDAVNDPVFTSGPPRRYRAPPVPGVTDTDPEFVNVCPLSSRYE